MKKYCPRKFANLLNGAFLLLIIVALTFVIMSNPGPISRGEMFGLAGFWVIGLILLLAPLGFRLNIDSSEVRISFLGFLFRRLSASKIKTLEYGNLFRGGLGFGKGLKGWEEVGGGKRLKYFSIGENFWGKEAVAQVRQVLEKKS